MSEKIEVKRDSARAQKNSGRGKIQKGDAVMGSFLYDIKESAESFTLSKKVWAKICTDAYTAGQRIPALKVVLGSGNNKVRLWVIEDSTFQEMKRAWDVANRKQ